MDKYRSNGKHLLNNKKGGHPASLRGRNLTENGKICTKCKMEKPMSEFRSEAISHCIKCLRAYGKRYAKRKYQKLW